MPEGHSIHRVALQLDADFVGRRVTASSPQGRFVAGAGLLDGLVMSEAFAVGKHLCVAFADDGGQRAGAREDARWLRVHLGLYGAWDFHGRVSPIGGNSRGIGSIGAPRLRRAVRIGEQERALPGPRSVDGRDGRGVSDGTAQDAVGGGHGDAAASGDAIVGEAFPPDPVGQVRLRLLTNESVADLRGPSRCEVIDYAGVEAILAKAGPDPRVDHWEDPEGVFVTRLRSRRVAVGQLLMDQSVVSGIGNIYRAEMLFRARLDPFTPGAKVTEAVARGLWRDWAELLGLGVEAGVILTREDLDETGQRRAAADRSIRFAVYGRAGEPCYRCGQPIALADMAGRKLYWCPRCQA